jgi:hypothetical protein
MNEPFRVRTKGYIARGVKSQTKSYKGRKYETDAEKFELTQPDCLAMTPKLIGKPVWHKHNQLARGTEPVRLGKIVGAHFDPELGDWKTELELEGLHAQLLWEAHMQKTNSGLSLSLSHNEETLEPIEVSICREPAREGCVIITNEDFYTGDARRNGVPIQAAGDMMTDSKAAAPSAKMEVDSKPALPQAATPVFDFNSREGKLALIKKAAQSLPEGPEREAYLQFELDREKRADASERKLKEAERQKAEAERLRTEAEKQNMQLYKTFSQGMIDILQQQGKDTREMEKDMATGHLAVHKPYMQEICAAMRIGGSAVKQPTPQQQQKSPAMSQWDAYMQKAAMEDSQEEKMESGAITHTEVPLEQAVEASGGGGGGSAMSSYEAYMRSMSNLVDDSTHSHDATSCVPNHHIGRDLGYAGSKRGMPAEEPIGPSGGPKRRRVDM